MCEGEEYRSRFYDEHFVRAIQVNENNLQVVPLFIGNNCKLPNVIRHPFDTNCYTFENDIGKFSVLDGDYIYKDSLNRLCISKAIYFANMFEKVKPVDESYELQYVRKRVGQDQSKEVDVIKYEAENRDKIDKFLSQYGYKVHGVYGIGGIVAIRKPGQVRGKFVNEGQYIVADKLTGKVSIYHETQFRQMFDCVGVKVEKPKEIKIDIGDTVQIGQYEYIVAHINKDNVVYLILKYSNGMNIEFDICTDTSYERSTIREMCKTWWKDEMPNDLKPFLLIPECGHGCPVFIPTLAQVASITRDRDGYYRGCGLWEYFADDESRKFKNESGTERIWWLQTPYPEHESSFVCCVGSGGLVGLNDPRTLYGFRPALCVYRKILEDIIIDNELRRLKHA